MVGNVIPADARAGLWQRLAGLARGPIANAGIKSLALQVTAMILGFAQAMVFARVLGAAGYGMLAAAVEASAILAVMAVGGFDQYAVRELARLRAEDDLPAALAFLRFTTRLVLAASLLAGIGLAVAAVGADAQSGWRTTFILAGALTPLTAMMLLNAGRLRGLGAVVFSQTPIAVVRPCTVILAMALLWAAGMRIDAPLGMTTLLVATFVAQLVAAAGLSRVAATLGQPGAQPSRVRAWLMEAAPFFGTAVLVVIFSKVSTLMLAALVGPEAAGLFQPIAILVPVLALPVGALAMPFAPRVVELWRIGDAGTLRRITWMYTISTFIGTCFIGITVLIFGEYVLSLFGPEFVAVAPALVWVVAATIVFAALGPCEILSSMMNAQRTVLAAAVIGLTLTVALTALLIPVRGVEGAAMAFAVGIVSGRSTILALSLRRFGFDTSLLGALRFAILRT
jgi:O-antigen/teichoic acid export membrane protein